MEKFVPVEKRSKKEQKIYYAKQRGSWNGVNPVTKVVPSKKIYNRKQAKRWKSDPSISPVFCLPSVRCYGVRLRSGSFHAVRTVHIGQTLDILLVRRLTGFQAPFPALRRGDGGNLTQDVLHMTAIRLLLFLFCHTSRSLSYFPGHS